MKTINKRCLKCKKWFTPDKFNVNNQKYCGSKKFNTGCSATHKVRNLIDNKTYYQRRNEKIVTLFMLALEGEKLSEEAWKKITQVNSIIIKNK